jgi:hypothetical protein
MTTENTTKKNHTIAKMICSLATSYTVTAAITAAIAPASLIGFAAAVIGSGVIGAHTGREVEGTIDVMFDEWDGIKEDVSEAIENVSKSIKTKVAA